MLAAGKAAGVGLPAVPGLGRRQQQDLTGKGRRAGEQVGEGWCLKVPSRSMQLQATSSPLPRLHGCTSSCSSMGRLGACTGGAHGEGWAIMARLEQGLPRVLGQAWKQACTQGLRAQGGLGRGLWVWVQGALGSGRGSKEGGGGGGLATQGLG